MVSAITRLTKLGVVPTVPATELLVGDQVVFHHNERLLVKKIEEASPAFFVIEFKNPGKKNVIRKIKKTRYLPVTRNGAWLQSE